MDKTLIKAVKRFNSVMADCEDMNVLKINDDDTLVAYYDPDFKPKNISDLIKETEYQISLYYEGGHQCNELYYEDNKEWHRKVNRLKRLLVSLNKYKESD